jgi:hypothetical protein
MRTPGHSSHEDIHDNALARQYILNRSKSDYRDWQQIQQHDHFQ